MTRPEPPRWSQNEFKRDLDRAVEIFRARRLTEPIEQYREDFDLAVGRIKELMARTGNLAEAPTGESPEALELLTNPEMRAALRYLAGPPISEDDLKTLADIPSLAPSRLASDAATVTRIMEVIHESLDTRRFPWMKDGSSPGEKEIHAAVMASASLMAAQRVQTSRRHADKEHQEGRIQRYLRLIGLTQVEPRPIPTIREAPNPGEFCSECQLGQRKADIVIGLADGRIMPVECKVSNSALNSVTRLNNDAAAKADQWIVAFGRDHVVPSALLAGVFKLHNLEAAQKAGLTIFWSHRLKPLGQFVR